MDRQLHRLKHDILTRSYETRQFALARKIIFVSDSLHTENKQKKMSKVVHINVTESTSTEIDFEGMIPDTRILPITTPCLIIWEYRLPRSIHHPFLLKFNSLLHHQMVYGP